MGRRAGWPALLLALVCASASIAVPAGAAFAADSAADAGIRATVPTPDGAARRSGGDLGVRLSVPDVPAAADDRLQATADVGVRLTVPSVPAADENRLQATEDAGIRLTVPTTAEEAHKAAADIGVRIAEVAELTVRFDANGGSFGGLGSGEATAVRTLASGMSVGELGDDVPADPVRGGYRFAGWFRDVGATLPFELDWPVTETTTVYAGWVESPIPEKVVFDANGGTWDESAVPAGAAEGALRGYARVDADGKRDEAGAFWAPETYVEDAVDGDIAYQDVWLPGAPFGTAIADIVPVVPGGAGGAAGGGGGEAGAGGAAVTREGCAFMGWWTGDGHGGRGWGERIDVAGAAVQGPTTLHARWASRTVSVSIVDPMTGQDGNEAAEGWDGVSQELTLTWGEALPDAAGVYDAPAGGPAVPARPGYFMDGLWWHAPEAGGDAGNGAEGAGGAGADAGDTAYYRVDYGGASDPEAASASFAKAIDGPWTMLEHAVDTDAAGGDGVDDTVRLEARWRLAVRATVPVEVTFGLSSAGGEISVQAPDGFAIRSRTAAEVKVDGIRVTGDAAGLESLLRTSSYDRLVYGALGRNAAGRQSIDLTLAAEAAGGAGTGGSAPDGARVALALADTSGARGPARPSATRDADTEALAQFAAPAWTGGVGEEIGIALGLDLPHNLRLAPTATGEPQQIAQATFTIRCQQKLYR